MPDLNFSDESLEALSMPLDRSPGRAISNAFETLFEEQGLIDESARLGFEIAKSVGEPVPVGYLFHLVGIEVPERFRDPGQGYTQRPPAVHFYTFDVYEPKTKERPMIADYYTIGAFIIAGRPIELDITRIYRSYSQLIAHLSPEIGRDNNEVLTDTEHTYMHGKKFNWRHRVRNTLLHSVAVENLLAGIDSDDVTLAGFGKKSKNYQLLHGVVFPDEDVLDYLFANDGVQVE